MLGSLKLKLQTLSPLASPAASPTASPQRRRRPFSGWRRGLAQLREVQSDPECDSSGPSRRRRYTADRRGHYRSPGGTNFDDENNIVECAAGHGQVRRQAQYDLYLQKLLRETPAAQPDCCRPGSGHRQLAAAPEDGLSELQRVQALFPSDELQLFSRDTAQSMKGLIRKRSAPAARTPRPLSAKRPSSADADDDKENSVPSGGADAGSRRQFLMETAVTLTAGPQPQQRHLFLFSDILLVAKPRSGGNFKLKEKVRLSEMWLSERIEDVSDEPLDPASSFVMGWPNINLVATFSRQARDLWYNTLQQATSAQRAQLSSSAAMEVVFWDPASGAHYSQAVSVTPETTASELTRRAAAALRLTGPSPRLWVRPDPHQPATPLLGPELPLAIHNSAARQPAADPDHCGPPPAAHCQFLLRPAGAVPPETFSPPAEPDKKKKPLRKTPIRIHRVFRRTSSKAGSVDSAAGLGPGALFGRPLCRLCPPEGLPPPVTAMLAQLFLKGPYTVGIFRKSANARMVREIRVKLDNGVHVDLESVNIHAVAGLAKEFLRSLPEPLLGGQLYDEWRAVADIESEHDRLQRVRELCSRLPTNNVTLLRHLLCVLHHVVRRSHHNLMSAANVAVCVVPSLLWPACPAQALSSDGARRLPAVVALMVDRCDAIFGWQVLRLLGGRTARAGSEDDSAVPSGGGVHDDSPQPELLHQNDKMADTNLSRDSGLTLSDSQLYTIDDEEVGSTSSGQSAHLSASSSGRGSDHSYQPRSTDGAGVYTTPLRRPGGAVRQASAAEPMYARPPLRHVESAFQRQDWTRQHHPLRRSGKASMERCSTSEESLTARCRDRPAEQAEVAPSPMLRSPSVQEMALRGSGRLALPASPARQGDDTELSCDSSTLSDGDSTPHVSRSNSRNTDGARLEVWERACSGVETVPVTAAGRRHRRAGASMYPLPEQVIREQTVLSSRAKRLYAESLRLYQQQTAGGASPAQPPPLPPKQRLRRAAGHTVIEIADSGSARARRPVRRVSRREAQTQTDHSGEQRRPHVTLVSIEAAPAGWQPRQVFSGGPPPPHRPPAENVYTSQEDVYASSENVYASHENVYASPENVYALTRTQSAGSSNDGEESYV